MEQNKISNKLIITLIGIALITSIASLLMAIWCYNIKNNVSTEPKLNYTTAYIKFNDGTLMAVDIDEVDRSRYDDEYYNIRTKNKMLIAVKEENVSFK